VILHWVTAYGVNSTVTRQPSSPNNANEHGYQMRPGRPASFQTFDGGARHTIGSAKTRLVKSPKGLDGREFVDQGLVTTVSHIHESEASPPLRGISVWTDQKIDYEDIIASPTSHLSRNTLGINIPLQTRESRPRLDRTISTRQSSDTP
jgi:hypothetical protein